MTGMEPSFPAPGFLRKFAKENCGGSTASIVRVWRDLDLEV
jgi:hypothetical protein